MNLLKLIDTFSTRTVLPVEVDDIVDYLRACGIMDEIYFFDADIDSDVLQGTIVHWEYQVQGWTHKVADIYTAKSLSIEEKRLVQAKELLHILDLRIDRVNTPEEVDALITQMALPAADWKTDGDHARSDRIGILYSLLVLFPMPLRDLFIPHLKAEKIDIAYIVDKVALPFHVVEFIVSDLWAEWCNNIMITLRAQVPVPDRVHTFNAQGAPIEVHSVGLESDPYTYAKRLEERSRGTANPISKVVIETRRERRTFTASELTVFAPRNGRV